MKPYQRSTLAAAQRARSGLWNVRSMEGLGASFTKAYLDATARTAFGFVLAMASSVRAAPLGCLRPCSHPCSVRTDTPSSAANCDCDKPVFLRASMTGEKATRSEERRGGK